MRMFPAVVLLAMPLTAGRAAIPVSARQQAVSQAATGQAAPSPASEADRKFAELTKATRLSEQVKLVPQFEQFIRDHPDYPRIDRVYSTLLLTLVRSKAAPDRVQALADEMLSKFGGDDIRRWTPYYAKFSLLDPSSDACRALGQQILKTETTLNVLQNAADYDKADALALLDKAIAERGKRPEMAGGPRLDELQWSYARALAAAGRTSEAIDRSIEVIDSTMKQIADLEPRANDVDKRSYVDRLREDVADRCAEFVRSCLGAGRQDLALRYLGVQEQAAATLLDRRPDLRTATAKMYEKLGRTDLALDGLARSLATRMDPSTRDDLVRLAQEAGKNPEDFYEQAREIRNRNAKAAYPFALATDEGQSMKLADIRAKATLVCFFTPG